MNNIEMIKRSLLPAFGVHSWHSEFEQVFKSDYSSYEFFKLINGVNGAYLITKDNDLIFSFAGSDQTEDWLLDCMAMRRTTPLGDVHAGFYAGYELFAQLMEPLFLIKKLKPKRVISTGHSYGGALARLNHESIKSHCDAYCITYGAPRVSSTFKDSERILRIVLDNDWVPRLPKGSYKHDGDLLWLNKDGSVIMNEWKTLSWWRHILELIFDYFKDKKLDAMGNHLTIPYLNAVLRYLGQGNLNDLLRDIEVPRI